MFDTALLRTAAEMATESAGASLALSLPKIPVTIGLSGTLGTGKTAFMRGFLHQCGITGTVASPTYALEQRYPTERAEILHIDLYRLSESEALTLLHGSEHHLGIRCIEWPEKAGDALRTDIRVSIEELPNGHRSIEITCDDVSWPSDEAIDTWRAELMLPANIGAHCDAVADFCKRAADALIARGTFVRKGFLCAAARTHDVLRFVDFHDDAAPAGWKSTDHERRTWSPWKERFRGMSHEDAVREFLTNKGFPELAHLAASHSIRIAPSERNTTEEHLLYYADKRCIGDRIVSVTERYDDFGVRYGKGLRSDESHHWERETIDTERLLFPYGIPF